MTTAKKLDMSMVKDSALWTQESLDLNVFSVYILDFRILNN